MTLKPEDAELGLVALRFSTLGRPAAGHAGSRPDEEAAARAAIGVGGIDLDPEPGSRAAAYEQKVREHPRRYAAIQTASGVAKVVVPLLLVYLLARFTFSVPLPDVNLPSIPRPDLPDLPSIPWPDINLPDWSLPGWVREVLEKVEVRVAGRARVRPGPRRDPPAPQAGRAQGRDAPGGRAGRRVGLTDRRRGRARTARCTASPPAPATGR